jgi:hypothetical protein
VDAYSAALQLLLSFSDLCLDLLVLLLLITGQLLLHLAPLVLFLPLYHIVWLRWRHLQQIPFPLTPQITKSAYLLRPPTSGSWRVAATHAVASYGSFCHSNEWLALCTSHLNEIKERHMSLRSMRSAHSVSIDTLSGPQQKCESNMP